MIELTEYDTSLDRKTRIAINPQFVARVKPHHLRPELCYVIMSGGHVVTIDGSYLEIVSLFTDKTL